MERLDDRYWMTQALRLAEQAAGEGEVPVGAILVCGDAPVAMTYNHTVANHCATAHAELLAIEEASAMLGRWRLSDCTLYVTLEPCSMCAGAIVNSRVRRVVFAARDPRAGALGSLLNLCAYPLEARPEVVEGVCAEESLALLRKFFAEMRKKEKDAEI